MTLMQPSTAPLATADILESATGSQNHTDMHIQSVLGTEHGSRPREATILTVGDQSAQEQEYAETFGSNSVWHLASIELKEKEAPNYFNPIRPDSLENKISSVTFRERITKLNQQIATVRRKQNFYDVFIIICWLSLPTVIVVVISEPLTQSAQITLIVDSIACLIVLFLFSKLIPTVSSICDRAIESWEKEDALLNVNLEYKKTKLMVGIAIYERVYDAEAGVPELPAYEN